MLKDITFKLQTELASLPRFLDMDQIPARHLERKQQFRKGFGLYPANHFCWMADAKTDLTYISRNFRNCMAGFVFMESGAIGFQHIFPSHADAFGFGVQIQESQDQIAGAILLGNDTIYPADLSSRRETEKSLIFSGMRSAALEGERLESLPLQYLNLNPPLQTDTIPTRWIDIVFDHQYVTAWAQNTLDCFFVLPTSELRQLAFGES